MAAFAANKAALIVLEDAFEVIDSLDSCGRLAGGLVLADGAGGAVDGSFLPRGPLALVLVGRAGSGVLDGRSDSCV